MHAKELEEALKVNSKNQLVGATRLGQTPEITKELRSLEAERKRTHQFRHEQKLNRAFDHFPWCGFCGCELKFAENKNNRTYRLESNEAVVHRFYRNIPKGARVRLSGTCTSIIICKQCNDDLDRLYAMKRIAVLRERDGLPIEGGQ